MDMPNSVRKSPDKLNWVNTLPDKMCRVEGKTKGLMTA
jgi:hypothetical protein